MFVCKPLRAEAVAYNYTDALIETYDNQLGQDSFKNNYINLLIDNRTLQWFAQNKWVMPTYKPNRSVLSAEDWEREHKAFLDYGPAVQVNKTAKLCYTNNRFKIPSYLIWLEFTGPDGVEHKIDIFINEQSKAGKYFVTKTIDGVLCDDVYNSIITSKKIEPVIAKKLHSIGSASWQGTKESKTQYKLNSHRQQRRFENAASKCNAVKLEQLDPYDDFLYKGSPGDLADYDLTVNCVDGTSITARIDLKLLLNLSTIDEQNKHDAEILIASTLLSNEIRYKRVANFDAEVKIEDTEEFKKFLDLFEAELSLDPPGYIEIKHIDCDTGTVTYNLYS